MLSILYLILILGVLIFVHEFGHFIAAKKIGVYVNEFAIGMGPVIYSFKRKNDPTVYSIRLFPIGGFCAMAGEAFPDGENLRDDQYMCNRGKFERFVILVAGVFMNIVLAILLLFVQSIVWGNTEQRSFVGYAPSGYPVSDAGIEVGDRIISINGHSVDTWDKITLVMNYKSDKDYTSFEVLKKDGSTLNYDISPMEVKDDSGNVSKVYGIGAGDKLSKSFLGAFKYAFYKLYSLTSTMFLTLGNLFTGNISIKSFSGPVGMYSVVAAASGFEQILFLMAYLSVNLAVINILPFPAFDGGRILFVVIELFKGSKVKPEVENMFHGIGFILLMLLMVYITIMDIIRLF